jgi:hypothetical protein
MKLLKWAIITLGLASKSFAMYRAKLSINSFEVGLVLKNDYAKNLDEKACDELSCFKEELDGVRTICFSNCTIEPPFLKRITGQKWKNLKNLNLYENKLKAKDLKLISKMPTQNLEAFYITYNHIESGGVIHLYKAPFQNLEKLHLSNNLMNGEEQSFLARLDKKKITRIEFGDQLYFKNKDENRLYPLFIFLNPEKFKAFLVDYRDCKNKELLKQAGCLEEIE